ncbi:hypothetical protein ACFQZ2_10035 [Streptomonospora algeriensis]
MWARAGRRLPVATSGRLPDVVPEQSVPRWLPASAEAAMADMAPAVPAGRVSLLLTAAFVAGLLASVIPSRTAARARATSLTSDGGGAV